MYEKCNFWTEKKGQDFWTEIIFFSTFQGIVHSEEEVNHRDDHVNNNGGKIQTEQLYYPVTSAEIIREKDHSNPRIREGLLRKGLQNHRIRGGGVGLNRAGGTVS